MIERSKQATREAALFLLVAGLYFMYLLRSGYDRFYLDAEDYWLLGDLFESGGHFSLLAFEDDRRGYSLPLLNHFLDAIASSAGWGEVTIVKLPGALTAATLGVFVLPRLARMLFPSASVGWGRVLALNVVIFLYWRDHFAFPLADFPALLAAAVALLALLRATTPGYVIAGLGFGLAANLRPAYLPALLGAVAVAGLSGRSAGRRRSGLVLVLAGALVASLPQVLINQRHGDSWSYLAPGSGGVSGLQLTAGMRLQKYESYVGAELDYPQPEVRYLDPATTHVLEEEEGLSEVRSYGQYARIVIRHPAEIAAGYVRRIFNGLDVTYPTPYIRDLGNRSTFLSLLQYTLMFLALARLLLPDARSALGRAHWAAVALLVSPCLTALPTAVEPRFFLPLQALVYMLVCFGPGTGRSLFGETSGRRAGLLVSYVAFLAVCLSLSSATLAQLEHPGPTLGIAGTITSPRDCHVRDHLALVTSGRDCHASSG